MSEPHDTRDRQVAVRALGRGRYLVGERIQRIAYAATSPDGTWVFIDGQVVLVGSASEAPRRRELDDQTVLAAPMPATVVAVNVAPGQRVAAGEMMVLLEAMKMEISIPAPRDAVVTRVACSVGELVQPGVQLLELGDD